MQKFKTITPQARQLLAYLLINRLVTTIQCRDELSIMSPASRIKELRDHGWPIDTICSRQIDAVGIEHRVAQYYLRGEKRK